MERGIEEERGREHCMGCAVAVRAGGRMMIIFMKTDFAELQHKIMMIMMILNLTDYNTGVTKLASVHKYLDQLKRHYYRKSKEIWSLGGSWTSNKLSVRSQT